MVMLMEATPPRVVFHLTLMNGANQAMLLNLFIWANLSLLIQREGRCQSFWKLPTTMHKGMLQKLRQLLSRSVYHWSLNTDIAPRQKSCRWKTIDIDIAPYQSLSKLKTMDTRSIHWKNMDTNMVLKPKMNQWKILGTRLSRWKTIACACPTS